MATERDIWFKDLTYELALAKNRTIQYAIRRIDEFGRTKAEEELYHNGLDPIKAVEKINNYFKEEEEKRQIAEEQKKKEARGKRQERHNKILERIKSKPIQHSPIPLERQLGHYIGDQIVSRHLPTLSTDSIQTNNVIMVSEEDAKEHARLEAIWWNTTGSTIAKESPDWLSLLANHRYLEKKYLPPILECYVHRISSVSEDMSELKYGIRQSLWDCDCCSYNTDPKNILIEDGELWFTKITLYLKNKENEES